MDWWIFFYSSRLQEDVSWDNVASEFRAVMDIDLDGQWKEEHHSISLHEFIPFNDQCQPAVQTSISEIQNRTRNIEIEPLAKEHPVRSHWGLLHSTKDKVSNFWHHGRCYITLNTSTCLIEHYVPNSRGNKAAVNLRPTQLLWPTYLYFKTVCYITLIII